MLRVFLLAVFSVIAACLLLTGCQSKPEPQASKEVQAPAASESPAPPRTPSAQVDANDTRRVLITFGDSLSAGYGVDIGSSYPDFLQRLLDENQYPYRVVNQGISGDTSSGGRQRVQQALTLKPAIIVLELGGNDGLRGIPLEETRANLDYIVREFTASGAKVLLSGMTLPPNYGPDYIREFEQIYRDLRDKYKPTYMRFLLDDVYDKPGMMQSDGIHPTVAGNQIVARNVYQALRPILKK